MTDPPKKRVLFVCIGNACRSQMAEAFANFFGKNELTAASAGLSPAYLIPRDTIRAMNELGIDVSGHYPKTIQYITRRTAFDLVINISGLPIPEEQTGAAEVRMWDVEDPVTMSYEDHCVIRDQIERLVMNLILELRRKPKISNVHPFESRRAK